MHTNEENSKTWAPRKMSITDLIWAIFWFGGGCFVFQIYGLKSIIDSISATVSVLSLITLVFK